MTVSPSPAAVRRAKARGSSNRRSRSAYRSRSHAAIFSSTRTRRRPADIRVTHHPRMPIRTLVLLLALSLLGVRPASAQNATLNCTVVDGSNALVPGASAVLRNVATGVTTESVSNGQGLVSFPSARPGLYELTISLEGFAPIPVPGLRLEVGESRAVPARLEPGDVRETVTVTAAATPLANDRADRGVVVENKFVQSIP